MDIQFQYDTFYEEDDTWTALFVCYNGTWVMAQPIFGTEDKELIKEMLENS